MIGKANHAGRLLCVLLLLVVAGHLSAAETRDSLWDQVDEAIQNRLPRTAMAVLDEIIPGAIEDQAYAEATRAVCLKIALEGQIQGGKAEEQIVLLETEIAEAPEPMKPVMETILAHWYWQYFKQNSWRFIQRTQTAEPPGADITTWDLPRILAEIDLHFTLALGAEQELKTIPVDEWDDLLEQGTVPDSYRPTLYDFLVFEALSFYSAGEQAGTVPQDTFEIMADSPVFGSVAEFLAWQPETSDTDSAKLKAIGLYQDLLAFHQDDSDKSAFIDADLNRLMFGNNQALGPDKAAFYIAALARFVDLWADSEIAARALYEWARVVHAQGDYARAHVLASRGWKTYPDSTGGVRCYNLIQQIEAKSATIKTEWVWSDTPQDINVTYRNVTRVFFRAVPFSFETWLYINSVDLEAMLKLQPALEWSADLPATTDYQQRTEALAAPEDLDKGFYFLIASHDPAFEKTDNKVSIAPVQVSDLALVLREHGHDGSVDGFVLDAESGAPLAGATVTRWIYDQSTLRYRPDGQVSTDENGLFTFTYHMGQDSALIVAEYQGQLLASWNTVRATPPRSDPKPQERTIFFTDRSLYRPGQTIHYKGICIHTDPAGDNYQTLAGRSLTVVFRDTSGQEIARQEHGCNDYGAFSGSFTAPRDRLMGRMSLRAQDGPDLWGWANFNVEEYKRPKFRVQLDAPAEAPRLDTEVAVPGKATAYTGAAIGGAQVKWSVVRQVRFPIWCWWARWSYPSYGAEQVIAHGTAITEADGSFSIPFTAKPDLSILEEDEPVFAYRVHADVTDTTGETRSGEHVVRAGYTALEAAIHADAWQTPDEPVELIVTTQSIDGQAEPAAGKVHVYTLKQPEKVIRPSLGSAGSQPDPSDPNAWEPADLIGEHSFQTDAQGLAVLPMTLQAGVYRAVLQTQDRFGKPVAAQHTIHVVDPEAKHFGVRVANHFAAPKWTLEPGESFMALWGTGYDTGRAYVELECRGELLRAWWTDPNRTQEVIEEQVTEYMRGGFTLRVTYVRENLPYINERIVDVPWTNQQLTIQWERFRSLLEPGQEEVWTAVITGSDASKAVAEMVAGMYDASLDQYLQHDWPQGFAGFRRESPRLDSRFQNGVITLLTVLNDWSVDYLSTMFYYRHFPYEIVYSYYGWSGAGAVPSPGGRTGGSDPSYPSYSGDETTTSYSENDQGQEDKAGPEPAPDLGQVSARKNLNETAFFFPHLLSDAEGVVRIEFTIPEALTEWRFMGF
ncbi:MAG TPA: MG2 domain-containing protein, partial [Sedimentisphaerales bacterium]|nr:MG2 domain-containing protein [Sedimentisphaerales bacterium]